MKLLDPQSALLTTAEVYQFLKDNPQRDPDKKIGSYPTVNLHNYQIIRSDLENYTTINHPHLLNSPPCDTYMGKLLHELQPYALTKAEVYALINLGVGAAKPKAEDNTAQEAGSGDDSADEQQESELARSLFRLVVEESEQRFEGEEGEQKIDHILSILGDALQNGDKTTTTKVNGHHGPTNGTTNGTSDMSE